ncbi:MULTISPECIES: hypothetical protein [Paenibacillus]|uniref:hypothetical protein n=1 Tax=Paenibacillus TaxID=44249 RepID=UPI0015EB761F|nr:MULTISPECIES: hypothetical protein [Paenibacillus]
MIPTIIKFYSTNLISGYVRVAFTGVFAEGEILTETEELEETEATLVHLSEVKSI